MKNILVPVDFSEKCKNAVNVAVQLAQKNNAKIYLLHALDLPVRLATESPNSFPETIYFMKLAQQRFEQLRKEISSEGVEIQNILETNIISSSVEEAIKKHHIDLVVMASNGASGIKEIFIGSNAEKIVRNSEVPVLVIKHEHSDFNINNIVFACDFSDKYAEAMKKATDFAKMFDAKIDLLYVNTPYDFKTTREINDHIHHFVSKFDFFRKFEVHIYNDIRIEDGVINFCAENNTDLVCMFPSGRKGIAHFFNGSVSEDLINHAQTPILTIKI